MADEWYCEIAGREIGPLSAQQLRAMAAKGQILPNDCVRQGVQGSWILARQVKGLLGPASELPRPKPPVFQAAGSENLPVAQRLPETPAAPPPPPPTTPVVPPTEVDVFDPVALGILADEPVSGAGMQARTKIVFSRERRRLERQKITVGALLVAVVGLAIVSLLLAVGGGSPEPGSSGAAAPAKGAPAAKANAESPEVLESREGIESLDSPKRQPRKISAETRKTPAAADSDNDKTSRPRASKKAVPP
jgi:GYF domain 2